MTGLAGEGFHEEELISGLKKSLYERSRFLDPTRMLEVMERLKEWVGEEVVFEEGSAASLGRLLSELHAAKFVDQLPPLVNAFERLVSSYFVRRGSVVGFYTFCNAWREALIRRILLMAEEGLVLHDRLPPSAPYALLASGTVGRREQTLEDAARYFLVWSGDDQGYFDKFAYRLLAILEGCSLLGRNATQSFLARDLWRGSLERWSAWCCGTPGTGEDEQPRRLELLADLRFIAGDRAVAGGAQAAARNGLKEARGSEAHRGMVLRALAAPLAISSLGYLQLERGGQHAGSVNLRTGALVPLVALLRLLAVEHDLEPCPSSERIRALAALGALEPGVQARLLAAHDYFFGAKISREIALHPPYLNAAQLPAQERQALTAALLAVRDLQEVVAQRFNAFKSKGAAAPRRRAI